MSEEFQYIDPKPLASASVAQVHRAKLRTGEDVVLKVRASKRQRCGGCVHACRRQEVLLATNSELLPG